MTETDHHEWSSQLGAYAIGALEPTDRAALEQHLAGCARCRKELGEYQATFDALAQSTPVPDRVWGRIESAMGSDHAAEDRRGELAPETTRTPRASTLRRRWLVGTAGVAAAAAAIVLALVATNDRGSGTPTVQAQVVPASTDAQVSGEVRLFDPGAPDGRIVLDLTTIPPSPAGHHYRVWVLRAESGGTMEAIGAFSSHSGMAMLDLPLPGPGTYSAVDISVQEDGGSAEHSGVSIAGAVLS